MSENANKPEQSKPGKRLEQAAGKADLPLTPEEARAKKELRIMIIMIIAAVIMVIAASGVLLYNRWFKKPSLPPGPTQLGGDPSVSPVPGESAEAPPDIDAIQPKVGGDRRSKDIYTILVFGEDVVSRSTDTMMLVTYDVTNQRASVMSLPRDTLVNVRRSNKQLNAVYNAYKDSKEGTEALKSEVSELVGFTPDYYVKVDWELVGEMVEAIGGVWFDVPRDMHYDDPIQNLHIHQEMGYRKLNGDDAMQVVRFRHSNDGSALSDLERLNIQHGFLKAVLKQTLQIQNVTKITQLAELFGRRVDSDLSVENLFWFGSQAIFGGLSVDDVEFLTMPSIGVYKGVYKYRVYPDQEELLKLINEKLNPFVEEVTIRQLDLIRVSEDGNSLSSSTGVLAGSSGGTRPVSGNSGAPGGTPSQAPRPTAPAQSPPPRASDPVQTPPPRASDPVQTLPPQASDPVETEPPAQPSGPVETEPPVVEPLPTDAPVIEPSAPPQGGGEDPGNNTDGT